MTKLYVVYAWFYADGTPYFVSFCESKSLVCFKPKHGIEPPSDKSLVQILYSSPSQEGCVQFLENYTNLHGLEQDGSEGCLKNSVHQPVASLKSGLHPNAISVDVYNLSLIHI